MCSKIKERQDAVEEIAMGSGNTSVAALYALIKAIPDLERIICRIHYKKCSPAEFANALRCFKK
jgi:DNA mismatch repair protein MSH3